MREPAREYYFVLRTVLRRRPSPQVCLTRCLHCRILFLTHPRNRGRKDLGCPFGCADAHRKEQSAKRSTAYYRTPAGKVKKARLNGKRRQAGGPRNEPQVVSARTRPDEIQLLAETGAGETRFPAGIVEHVRVVTSLIEGVEVSREEVVTMLEKVVRQRRFVRERRRDYVLHWLAEHSP